MQQTVGIIGTGWVGTSVAISTLHSGAADALWLHDVRGAVAEGEAMDLAHGAAFYPPCEVKVATVEAMRACQVVVVAAGRNGKPGESRLDLLRDNARVVADIGRTLAGFDGTIVLVSNPVDVLTQVMTEASGLPPARVLGTGTLLDTARLRQMLAQRLQLATTSIHAQVVGEHGDSEVVLWSGAQVGGVPLRQWPGWDAADEAALALEVRRAAYEVIARKGATNHAIGLVTAHLLRCMLRGEQRVLTVSRVQEGAFGLHGVALSLPTVVGHGGGGTVLEPGLDAAELAALEHSAEVLRQARATLPPG
ncbi:lactate/malate family dehydrogenase [Pseudaquabacterium pictum]|uniref:L-lactate dehydrogenase n=1 Tax=Pseudaquabacterium pictum TaxID=2315236 RepID=A0A480ANQ3_9BURK|nr:L-lactate dehydrogenase [Rubrivivax pictus]GCL61692.1 L-lactate dehydrogenase [Rubrivivax pictus]